MNAQAVSFADLENPSDLDGPTYLEAQAMAAQRQSVQRHSGQRYGNSYVPANWNGSRKPATPVARWSDKHQDCIAKINAMASRGSNWAKSVQTYYNTNGYMAPGHVNKIREIMADDAARVAARTTAPVQSVATPVQTNGIDLRSLPDGRYAVPHGDTRLKVLINRSDEPKWEGFIFVSDAAEYGQRQKYGTQTPNRLYTGKIQEQLRTIIANPKAAAIAYGRLTNHCACCGRMLEDAESVARGIGPVCADKRGW